MSRQKPPEFRGRHEDETLVPGTTQRRTWPEGYWRGIDELRRNTHLSPIEPLFGDPRDIGSEDR